MLQTPPAAAVRRQPSPLILAGSSAEDGDISLATTLPSPPLGTSNSRPGSSNGSVFLERPSQLRRSSSHHSPSSGSSSPGLGIGGGPLGQAGSHARKRKSTLTRVNEMPTTLLPVDFLARLKEWIETVVIVNFDLDRGPGERSQPSMSTQSMLRLTETLADYLRRFRQLLPTNGVFPARTACDRFCRPFERYTTLRPT